MRFLRITIPGQETERVEAGGRTAEEVQHFLATQLGHRFARVKEQVDRGRREKKVRREE